MASYKISGNAGLPAFPVASIFVDKYMPKANATFVKVYLYGLRLCYAIGTEPDNKSIAKALDVLESDVRLAWKYWEEQGVIRLNEDDGIEFVDLTLEASPAPETSSKPQYKAKELAEAISDNSDISLLMEHAQNIFGKTFGASESAILYSFYDWLNLPIEVILILLEHCASLEKYSMRYAEKIAIAWADEGIDTIDKAEQHIKNSEKRYKLSRKYKRLFNLGRDISDAEYAHIIQWTETMEMPQELIKLAYEKAVMATGSVSFPYINAILQSWHRQNVKTAADVKKDEHISKPKAVKKNKFLNYEQTATYDFEEIERRAMEKRMKAE